MVEARTIYSGSPEEGVHELSLRHHKGQTFEPEHNS